jgi:hypothetical protein
VALVAAVGTLVAAAGAVAACRIDPGPAVGLASLHPVASSPGPTTLDASAAAPSPVAADFRERMARVGERGVSHGHADRFDGVVWVNEAAHVGWDGPGEMPDGAMLAEEAIERTDKGDRPAGLLVMEKRAGAWRFVVVDAGGHVVEWSRAESCAACHRDAPRDFVFRVVGAAAGAPDAGR